jgi:peroxiredoxin
MDEAKLFAFSQRVTSEPEGSRMANLADELEAFTCDVVRRRGAEEASELFEGQIQAAYEAAVHQSALAELARAPDFSLCDSLGDSLSLRRLLKAGPAILVFYRGSWCPYCNIQLRALSLALDEIDAMGGTLVAISPEAPDPALLDDPKRHLGFPVLFDRGNLVAREFGLVFTMSDRARALLLKVGIDLEERNANGGWELPVPATFVVTPDGTIAARFLDVDYRKRPEPRAILAALKECAISTS